jgi:hypothetical protein
MDSTLEAHVLEQTARITSISSQEPARLPSPVVAKILVALVLQMEFTVLTISASTTSDALTDSTLRSPARPAHSLTSYLAHASPPCLPAAEIHVALVSPMVSTSSTTSVPATTNAQADSSLLLDVPEPKDNISISILNSARLQSPLGAKILDVPAEPMVFTW